MTSAGCGRASSPRGLIVGETPNIDRIGNEGAIFFGYVAMQSCTSGRNAFFNGILRDRM
jgi:arylsulfatase A-like enzyme